MLYWALCEQARHEHMSDEYKDRYNIIALLKTPLGTTDNRQYENITVVSGELNEVGEVRQTKQRISQIQSVDRLLKLP